MAFPGFAGDISLAFVPLNGVVAVLYVGTATGGTTVAAFGSDGTQLRSFVAYPGNPGGVQLAAGDTSANGSGTLLTLAVGTTHEKAFTTAGGLLESFFAAPGPGVDLTDSLLYFAREQNV
jgi:serralysin